MCNRLTNSFPIGERWIGLNKTIMNKLEKQEGVYYTQNIENLPIEERIFFKEGKGVTATNEYYRPASPIELNDWAEYKKQQESAEII